MARAFVIKRESRRGHTELERAARHSPVTSLATDCVNRPVLVVGRLDRRPAEKIEHIHQQQFLMLLLVGKTQAHQVLNLCRNAVLQQRAHMAIDVAPVRHDVRRARACQKAALCPWLARPKCLVVGVEQVAITRIEATVTRQMDREHHGFEEPGGMRQMPLGWTGVRHRLDNHVFGAERPRQGFGLLSNACIAIAQLARIPECQVHTAAGSRHLRRCGPRIPIGASERRSPRPELLHDKNPGGR